MDRQELIDRVLDLSDFLREAAAAGDDGRIELALTQMRQTLSVSSVDPRASD